MLLSAVVAALCLAGVLGDYVVEWLQYDVDVPAAFDVRCPENVLLNPQQSDLMFVAPAERLHIQPLENGAPSEGSDIPVTGDTKFAFCTNNLKGCAVTARGKSASFWFYGGATQEFPLAHGAGPSSSITGSYSLRAVREGPVAVDKLFKSVIVRSKRSIGITGQVDDGDATSLKWPACPADLTSSNWEKTLVVTAAGTVWTLPNVKHASSGDKGDKDALATSCPRDAPACAAPTMAVIDQNDSLLAMWAYGSEGTLHDNRLGQQVVFEAPTLGCHQSALFTTTSGSIEVVVATFLVEGGDGVSIVKRTLFFYNTATRIGTRVSRPDYPFTHASPGEAKWSKLLLAVDGTSITQVTYNPASKAPLHATKWLVDPLAP